MLDHGDLLRATVAEVVTADRADQTAVAADAVERLTDTGPVDDEVAVVYIKDILAELIHHGLKLAQDL